MQKSCKIIIYQIYVIEFDKKYNEKNSHNYIQM